MRRVKFIVSKDPFTFVGGDTVVTRLMWALAREAYEVSAVVMSDRTRSTGIEPDDVRVTRVKKPNLKPAQLVIKSGTRRRSLIHSRFNASSMRTALQQADADVFVAEHSYMAEPFLSARSTDAGQRLWVNTHVSESEVHRTSSNPLLRADVARVWRDELRVARAARRVGCFDLEEVARYEMHGLTPTFLDISMPPRPQVPVGGTAQRVVMLGDRAWKPNYLAVAWLLRLWPRIRSCVPEAELAIIGKGPQPPLTPGHDGVSFLGFVPDLDAYLTTSRAVVAPISVGGGVRVKLLESIAIGLPIVANATAIGSLDRIFGLTASNTDDEIVERTITLLSDANQAKREGDMLYQQNRERWAARAPHMTVQNWLRA